MNKSVIVIGASGHGKVVADAICRQGDTLLGFLDDNETLPPRVAGFPVLGKISEFKNYPNAVFIVAIGDSAVREKIVNRLGSAKWHTVIHPTAIVSAAETRIGQGSVVMANAVINPAAQIGCHSIINTAAVIEHDNRIGSFVHVSVGAKLGGTVSIGDHTWIGIGAIVSNNVSICEHCVIGAGAVVVDNIKESGTYVGVPARKIK